MAQGNATYNPPVSTPALILAPLVNDEQYITNQMRLKQAQEILNNYAAQNEHAHRAYLQSQNERMQNTMNQIIEERERAKYAHVSF
jgi:hypothetical protein